MFDWQKLNQFQEHPETNGKLDLLCCSVVVWNLAAAYHRRILEAVVSRQGTVDDLSKR